MLSVIVPNFNHAAFLQQRIESILNQTFQDFEVILLDDCSVDGSREVMERYRNHPRVSRLVFNDVNGGSPFRQWDKGIALAQGEWVWIAESDDYAELTFLERMMNEVAKVPDCSLAYTATWWVDEQGNKLWETPDSDRVNVYTGKDFIKQKLAVSNSIANVSECIFRRSSYRPEEGHRYEWMRLCGDWLFYVLLAEQGTVWEVEQPLSYYRQHGQNVSEKAERQGLTFLEGVEVLDYMIDHCGLQPGDYAKGWGRLWSKYVKQYEFTPEVQAKVRQCLAKHPEIVRWYRLYRIKSWLK